MNHTPQNVVTNQNYGGSLGEDNYGRAVSGNQLDNIRHIYCAVAPREKRDKFLTLYLL
jgi:hypothetical protein